MSEFYRLDGHDVVPCDEVTWARSLKQDRRVAYNKTPHARVSTVFLGMNHRMFDAGPPLIFETMIFGGPHDQYQERCSTWEQAEAMHARALNLVKETSK